MPGFTFPASERLKSKKDIQILFTKGKSIKRFPLRLLYSLQPTGSHPIQIVFAVPSKKIASAVHRNKVRRWMREAYRTQRGDVLEMVRSRNLYVHLALVYMDRELSDFEVVKNATGQLLAQLGRHLSSEQ